MPDGQQVAGWRISLVCIAIAFTLAGLYTGAQLALELGVRDGIRATLIGSAILAVMSVPAAMVGAQTRLSTYMIVLQVFGRHGSRFVNGVLAIVLLGWYAVTAELFGRTCFLTVGNALPQLALPQWIYTVVCSLVIIATTVHGFRAVERLSTAVAPLLVVLTVYVAWRSLQHVPWERLVDLTGRNPDLGRGISAVIGGLIVNVVVMPDITRYARSTFDCALISVAGNGIGGAAALILPMLPALAFGEQDPMKYMIALGLTIVAFVTLVLSTWSINVVNLYSTGLVTSTALPRLSYGRLVIAMGLVGTAVAVIGIADRLIDFLVLLGLIVPPVAAVYLVDFFMLGRRDFSIVDGSTFQGPTNLSGVLACAAGAIIGLAMYFGNASLSGVPTIESFVSAAVLYLLLEKLRAGTGRGRNWRLRQRAA